MEVVVDFGEIRSLGVVGIWMWRWVNVSGGWGIWVVRGEQKAECITFASFCGPYLVQHQLRPI